MSVPTGDESYRVDLTQRYSALVDEPECIAVWCPTCWREPTYGCVGMSGFPEDLFHVERAAAWTSSPG